MATVAENKLLKRSRILDEAFKLFTSKTVYATAIDDVVKAAGVAKGTFYLYFKDKYDLLDQIIIRYTTLAVEDVMKELDREQIKREMSFTDKALFLTDRFIMRMKENRQFVALIDKNRAIYLNAILKIDSENFKNFLKEAKEYLRKNGCDDEQAGKVIFVVLSMLSSVCCDSVMSGKPYTIDELKPSLHSIITKMIN